MDHRCPCQAAALILLLSAVIAAQSTAGQPVRDESVSKKVTNPIEFLMKFTVDNQYAPSLWNTRGAQNEVEGEAVIPFEAFARENLARIRVLFESSSPGGTHGLSESEIIDLALFRRRWGTFGFGVTSRLSPQTVDRTGGIAPGPAAGAVFQHEKWQYGFLNQNFLSDTFAQTEVQPILAYTFNGKWSAEIGEALYTYDWKDGRLLSIPLSGQVNRIFSSSKQDIQLFVRAEYNAKNNPGSAMWTLNAGITLIPKPLR